MNEALLIKSPPDGAPDPNVLQRRASNPDFSVWVGASAGSGKTTVLVNRVLRLLLAGVKPQKILCLTFTRAAAAEMSNRVAEILSRWAVCSDDDLRNDLDRLHGHPPEQDHLTDARRLFALILSCPGGMRIHTIHAFGQEILRRFPIEAGLPPHFAVIEETEVRAVLQEVQAELLQAASGNPQSKTGVALRYLVQDIGQRGFEDAMKAMLGERDRLAAALAQAGSLEKLTHNVRALFALAPGDSEEKFLRDAVDDRRLPRTELKQAAQWLLEGTKSYAARGQAMLAWLDLVPAERALAFADWCCFFLTKKDGDFFKNYGDKKLLEKHPDIDPLMRREAARLQSVRERITAARTAVSTEGVLTLGLALLQRFEARKATRVLLDYDDLIIRTDRLLRRPGIAPWVLYKLDGGVDHILVDEAQDTSRAQWSIVAALAEEFFAGSGSRPDNNRTLFVVGDEKQSIFSFQHADPAAFAEMRGQFERRINDAGKAWDEVPLHMSFRSAPAILRAVDAVFTDQAARAGVSSEPVQHYAAKAGKRGRVELWPLIPALEKDKPGEWVIAEDYEEERDPQAELAVLIAARIKNWIGKEKLPGHECALAPGDIMILLRRRGRFADLMVRALKKAGVPVTGVDRMRLVKQLAVMDLCALMQFVLLPEDDLNLAAVLRGPLLGLSEEQLMELAIGRSGSLWQSLRDKAVKKPAVFAAAHDYLLHWFNQADFTTPFAMLARTLNEACPGSAVSGRQALWGRLGPDALDPIDELLSAAQDFGHRHAPSLQSFLHWLMATEAEIKRELDRGGGQVRIMTVHASKGLEAPIVFLPDAANGPRTQDVSKLLFDKDGTPLYLARRPNSGAARRLWDEERRKQMEEYRRLFYVALTRAADRLYIGGWEPSRGEGENAGESWYALARRGLQPLHEPMVLGNELPHADIAFIDHGVAAKEKTAPVKEEAQKIALPAWVRQPVEPEPEIVRSLAPSQLVPDREEPPAASPDVRFARGRIIHRLLQSLPDIEDTKRDAVAARFLANPQNRLPKKQQAVIAKEVLDLLRDPDFAPLFGPGSRAEVPLAGLVGKQPMAGQIDRLCVRDDAVWIVDYKSNRPPPVRVEDVPLSYRKQLAAYAALLRQIYPEKPVRCFLLWTYAPRLMAIPDELLTGA